MIVKHLVPCDGPRCEVTGEARQMISPLGMPTNEWGAPRDWAAIYIERVAQGVCSNPPGGAGRMAFHSARCLLDWAAWCAEVDLDAPFHDPEVIGAAARYINGHVPAPDSEGGKWGPQEANEIATAIMRAVACRNEPEGNQ